MAVYKRLTVGHRPVVVMFPQWLLHDTAVDAAYRALRRALGPVPVYADAAQVVLVIPVDLLEDDDALWALHRLQDEITVWRLTSHDGTRRAANGLGRDVRARMAHHDRRGGRPPSERGWLAS